MASDPGDVRTTEDVARTIAKPPEIRCLLLRDCLKEGSSRQICFETWQIPSDYDWELSTQSNYTVPPAEGKQEGRFADIRATLDVDFHGIYSRGRQHFQDVLIQDVVGAANPKQHPWIVFTAGAMGAGKSHTISWMSARHYFPLPDVVQLDPDVFKVAFPEWQGYLTRDNTQAGTKTRRESGMLVEIAQEAAMRMSKNIWVDGSFRDDVWYAQVFDRIREQHPHYRIAILYVFAEPEVVKQRAKERAAETGRVVPIEEIEDSLRRVPRAVNKLGKKADFVAHIDNTHGEPALTDYCTRSGCFVNQAGSWQEVSTRFATLPELDEGGDTWRRFVRATVESSPVVLFSKSYCSYCLKLKALLAEYGVEFKTTELDLLTGNGAHAQLELAKTTGVWTVPQLFAFQCYIGDCERSLALHQKGELLRVLRGEESVAAVALA